MTTTKQSYSIDYFIEKLTILKTRKLSLEESYQLRIMFTKAYSVKDIPTTDMMGYILKASDEGLEKVLKFVKANQ